MRPREESSELGRAGETRAAWHYRFRGWRVLARNVRYRDGEIDLVVRRRGVIAFVEVKTRHESDAGEPWEAVDREKQLRIMRGAQRWVDQHHMRDAEVRFDVVSIVRTRWWFRVERFERAYEAASENGRPWRMK